MSDVRELMDHKIRHGQTIAGFWYATVTGPLPLDENDELYVIINDIDPNTKFGPCHWTAHVTEYIVDVSQAPEAVNLITTAQVKLPVIGSECLVLFDNRQNVWVAQWT